MRQLRTHEHCEIENILNNISHPVGRPTRCLSIFTHHYSRDLILNSLVYIIVHTTHQTFIPRHLFTKPQLYQVKQVPQKFDTQYSLTVLYYLRDPVHLPIVEQPSSLLVQAFAKPI